MGESARTPGGAQWPDKLITQAEAFAKAASWPIYTECDLSQGEYLIHQRCNQRKANPDPDGPPMVCGQSIAQLRRGRTIYNGSLDELLAAVLRHMVMAHEVPLNTRPPAETDPAPRIPGPGAPFDLGWTL